MHIGFITLLYVCTTWDRQALFSVLYFTSTVSILKEVQEETSLLSLTHSEEEEEFGAKKD